jgi:hypothetical protein
MGHVERPESESASGNLQFTRQHDKDWSQRRIARELVLNRETVGRYLRLAKPAISTTLAQLQCERVNANRSPERFLPMSK